MVRAKISTQELRRMPSTHSARLRGMPVKAMVLVRKVP